jgi:EmrB/QacA subfamily drug resistance transporter
MAGACSVDSATGRGVLAATLLASGASFIVWSAVTVALPSIQEHFRTNIAGMQWVMNSHLLTLSAFMLIGGSMGDHFGRKRVFLVGMLVFVTGALLSGFAPSIGILIAFQALQGIGSAMMVPQSLAIINACFLERERGRAIGIWAGISGGIAALGPYAGGLLIEHLGWPSVFWMTVPVVVIALAVAAKFIPENRDTERGGLDWTGTLLILLGLLGIVYGLIGGPVYGWRAPLVVLGLLGGGAAVAAFVSVEMRSSSPLIPMGIFRNPLVSGANAVTLLIYLAFSGVILFTVICLQQIQGYSPAEAGLGLLPPIVIITFLAAPSGVLADRYGPRLQMIAGPLMVSIGAALLMNGGTDAIYVRDFLPGLAAVGVGMALAIPPLTKAALTVEPRFSGSASGVNNAVARIAGLLAVALLGAVMVSTFASRLADLVEVSSLPEEARGEILSQYDRLAGIVVPESFSDSARATAVSAVRSSFIRAFRLIMIVCASLTAVGSVISTVTIRPRHTSVPDETRNRENCEIG